MIKNFIVEFRKFAMRGNVIDMAVGIIIGAAFGKIVDSLVKDIIMPPLGLLLGKIDFANMFFVLSNPNPDMHYPSLSAAQQAGAITLNLGIFINAVISFVIVAFAVFLLIKAINTLQEKVAGEQEQAVEKTTKACPYCYSEINKQATRCPNCTSDLEVSLKKTKAKKD
ncbi:MAG: large-conductance mechanosensitive channel protein MscL [Alphaproteobacteria bacterium]|nr:large-conductance mechanosensitive channel protein MscL [Alphaproteobacteria bacterium]